MGNASTEDRGSVSGITNLIIYLYIGVRSMALKILYVMGNTIFGGGERVFTQLISRLNKNRYELVCACLPKGQLADKLEELKIPLCAIDFRHRFSIKTFLKLLKIVQSEKPHIVHSQGARVDFYTRLTARLARVPIIVSTIAAPVEEFNVNPIKRIIYIFLDRLTEKYVDKFIAVSESMRRKLITKHKIPSGKIVRIYNGVEVENYYYYSSDDYIKKEFNIGRNTLLVGTIGRLVWEKGLEYFIKAIKEIEDSTWQMKDNIRFLIVGEGELRRELENLVKELKIEQKVVFTGFRKDINKILSVLNILVLSSLREGQPMVLLEAMAAGKPVIATNIEGLDETIIDGVTGILVPPKDPASLAKVIASLLQNRDKAEKMGQAGRSIVEERFNITARVKEYERLYDTLVIK
ncbi:hypothetical protein AC481_05560 [miscellaneous Crenarchaeota group archaeon SMTZ-80]|nr:MAG: hypothetical protein AC481_05560 [miscellaneous Crenarchaeota group archaeon SMTZ-80]